MEERVLLYPDVWLGHETIGLVLILLDLLRDFRHFSPLAEVDDAFRSVREKIWVSVLDVCDVGQIHA